MKRYRFIVMLSWYICMPLVAMHIDKKRKIEDKQEQAISFLDFDNALWHIPSLFELCTTVIIKNEALRKSFKEDNNLPLDISEKLASIIAHFPSTFKPHKSVYIGSAQENSFAFSNNGRYLIYAQKKHITHWI